MLLAVIDPVYVRVIEERKIKNATKKKTLLLKKKIYLK